MAEVGLEGTAARHGLRRFSHEAMATVFEVYIDHRDERYAAQAAHAAFDVVDGLERDLSRFVPNSDISRINDLAPGASTRVGTATLDCLAIARHVFQLTGGAFDVSIGTGLLSLELADDYSVLATRPGVRLDLGAIGKGYAVDRMADVLEEWGLRRSLVHGGFSSVLALDPPTDREGWSLTLSDPDPGERARVLARLSVRQVALGASGVRKGDHILDPRSGEPARARVAAWVALARPAPAGSGALPGEPLPRAAAAVADALTTAFMLLAPAEIATLCDRNPGLEAWILPRCTGAPAEETAVLHLGAPAE